MAEDWTDELRSLLDAPSPAVLTTYRKDGSALATPVWFPCLDGELLEGDMTEARTAIASRYLGEEAGARFAAERTSKSGVLLRLKAKDPRVWDLRSILPN